MATDFQSLLTQAQCFMCYGVSLDEGVELALLQQWALNGSLLNGIQLAWHFDADVQANNGAFDSVTNYFLAINNQGNLKPSTVPGLLNNAVNCNPTNALQIDGLVENTPNGNVNLHMVADRTVSLWLFPKNNGLFRPTALVAGVYNDITGGEWVMFYNPTAVSVEVALVDAAFNFYSVTSAMPVTWNHVVMTFNHAAKSISMYLNGVLVGSATAPALNILTIPFVMGDDGTQDNNGQCAVDELDVWNRILTPAEITDLYNSGTGKAYPF